MNTRMRNFVWATILGIVPLVMTPSRSMAQNPDSVADSARSGDAGVDSTEYVKAFDMVSNGEPEDGKALVDSLLQASKEGTPQYAEGLYWRARLASMGPGAERDYRRIIVEYPYNRRAADALLRLGQLELGRGDRDMAAQHFQRAVMDYPTSPVYAAANYWLARAYFAGNKLERACIANAEALAKVSSSDIELKNQIDFQNQQCRDVSLTPPDSAAVDSAPAKSTKTTKGAKGTKTASTKKPAKGAKTVAAKPAVKPKPANVDDEASDSTSMEVASADQPHTDGDAPAKPDATDDGAVRDSAAMAPADESEDAPPPKPVKTTSGKKTVPVKTAKSSGTAKTVYMVQVAAYQTRPQAEALVASLKKEGYTSHIDGKGAPYRVRLGRFTTRQAAVALLAKLKARQIDGFVTEG